MGPGGLIVLNKPVGLTSREATKQFWLEQLKVEKTIPQLKNYFDQYGNRIPKCGHIGTLDPFATGCLTFTYGYATKLNQLLPTAPKTYTAVLKLGEKTDTGDHTGITIETKKVPKLEQIFMEEICKKFLCGAIEITIPAYSSVRINGKRAYEVMRDLKKKESEEDYKAKIMEKLRKMPKKTIHAETTCRILSNDKIELVVECSTGTFIRSLGELLAEKIGTVGHLVELKREKENKFQVGDEKFIFWELPKVLDLISTKILVKLDVPTKEKELKDKIISGKHIPEIFEWLNENKVANFTPDFEVDKLYTLCLDGEKQEVLLTFQKTENNYKYKVKWIEPS
eukprot:augustus_masked-scaffold_3-processed-gene-12.0-mRNA-1 protein AED:0.34 eAED:0.36 QI:0/-1/0/1/-1/1/1/0/338